LVRPLDAGPAAAGFCSEMERARGVDRLPRQRPLNVWFTNPGKAVGSRASRRCLAIVLQWIADPRHLHARANAR